MGGAPPPPLDFAPQGVKNGHFSEGSRRGPGGHLQTPEDQRPVGWAGRTPTTHDPTSTQAACERAPEEGDPGGAWRPGRSPAGKAEEGNPPPEDQALQAPGPPGARLVSRVEVIRADHWVTAQMHPCRHPPSDQGSPRHPEAPDHHEVDTPPFGPNPTNSPNGHPRPAAPTIRPRRSRFVHPPGPDPRRGASKLTPLALRLGLRC